MLYTSDMQKYDIFETLQMPFPFLVNYLDTITHG